MNEKSIWEELDEISEKELLLEMATVGTLGSYEIAVRSNDAGNIPHFHIYDKQTLGRFFHTCIKIKTCEYFLHGNKQDILDSSSKKYLCKFLQSKHKNHNHTNWVEIIELWNNTKSAIKIPENLPMPDYTKL